MRQLDGNRLNPTLPGVLAWSTSGGNSPPPTADVPSYMGVLVGSGITKSGSEIVGQTTAIVVLKVNPGYGPNPGSTGTGVLVGLYCK